SLAARCRDPERFLVLGKLLQPLWLFRHIEQALDQPASHSTNSTMISTATSTLRSVFLSPLMRAASLPSGESEVAANALAPGLRSQSRDESTISLAMSTYLAQQDAAPASPERSVWIGGHGTEP